MSPPLIMDEKYAAIGMTIIDDAITEVEKEFGYK
jgi:4-aminobutyrate aminotransferase/4-aminobutyrate aminotransferase/(S)-3-amino-2-methylpropionate transaminase